MKLNIEELAREAENENSSIANWHHIDVYAFARLIVERCAQECDKKNPHPDQWSDQRDYTVKHTALDCAAAIRNLMED